MNSLEQHYSLLARRVLDGIGTDAERDELAQLSRQHPLLVTGIVEELMIDALLKWQSGDISAELAAPEPGPKILPLPPRAATRFGPLMLRWTVAAVLLAATGLVTWQLWQRTNPASPVAAGSGVSGELIADIVEQSGVVWAENSTALADGTAIMIGRLASIGGEYTLQFRSGAEVRVVGTASLDIKSKMLVQLEIGQATASVPESSIGFTITSPLVNVVDQGTQFGILVADARTEVIVFDGKVDLQSNIGVDAGRIRLTGGEGVQVDRQGTIGRLVDVRRDVQGRWWTHDEAHTERNVIASVTDNIWRGSEKKYACYQTTLEGLQEDAVAYSDNPNHQWNGLTAEGLPDFLRGADYVKTYNDYRYLLGLQMTIRLSGPANLYIFADNRMAPPEWLKDNFEDTGVDIGLDEGPWLHQVEEKYRYQDINTTATGAGNSIDNVFSVWRRRCVDGAPVKLGNAGQWAVEGSYGRAMYGIAATPIDAGDAASVDLDGANGT